MTRTSLRKSLLVGTRPVANSLIGATNGFLPDREPIAITFSLAHVQTRLRKVGNQFSRIFLRPVDALASSHPPPESHVSVTLEQLRINVPDTLFTFFPFSFLKYFRIFLTNRDTSRTTGCSWISSLIFGMIGKFLTGHLRFSVQSAAYC